VIADLGRRYEDVLEEILESGVASGSFTVPDVRHASMAPVATLTGVNTRFRSDGRMGRERVTRIYWNMALGWLTLDRGIGPWISGFGAPSPNRHRSREGSAMAAGWINPPRWCAGYRYRHVILIWDSFGKPATLWHGLSNGNRCIRAICAMGPSGVERICPETAPERAGLRRIEGD